MDYVRPMVFGLLLAACESVAGTWSGDCALGASAWSSEIDVTYDSLGSVEGDFFLAADEGIEGEGGGGFDGDQVKLLFEVVLPGGAHALARVDGVVDDDEMEADLVVESEAETAEMECVYARE